MILDNGEDSNWIRQAFMLKKDDLTPAEKHYRILTNASLKFTDTSLGGNFSINNPPQYTHYADPIVSMLGGGWDTTNNGDAYSKDGSSNAYLGMGEYYSRAIDDNTQRIFCQMGVPAFNGMISFFTGFFDNSMASPARTGRPAGLSYWAGRAVGFVVSLFYWQYIALFYGMRIMAGMPASKYYYMKPAMPVYWTRVNSIVNTLGVYHKTIAPVYASRGPKGEDGSYSTMEENDVIWSKENKALFHSYNRRVFREDGGIDMYAVASRAQRLADRQRQEMQKIAASGKNMSELSRGIIKYVKEFQDPDQLEHRDIIKYLDDYTATTLGSNAGTLDPKNNRNKDFINMEPSWRPEWRRMPVPGSSDPTNTLSGGGSWTKFKNWMDDSFKVFYADLVDGSQFAGFKVDFTGATNESFTNGSKEAEITSTINGISDASRTFRFSTSDGNTGTIVDTALDIVKGFTAGVLDSVSMSGLMSLAGSAFVDIPRVWSDSQAQFPTKSYHIELRSWSGHVMSRLINLYVPMSMFLAMSLPYSTGKASYTAPPLVMLYSKGRCISRLCMVDSLSISRGVGNIGWDEDENFLSVDIDISFVDLSSIMHAPVSPSPGLFSPLSWLGQDTAFEDYLSTLGGLSLGEMYYPSRRMILNLTRAWSGFKSNFSVTKVSNTIFGSNPVRMLNHFLPDPDVSIFN